MSAQLRLTLIQTALEWQQPQKNLEYLSALIEKNKLQTDIIILPEMFTTGFSMKPNEFAETDDGNALAWMKKVASSNNCAVTGSLMVKEKDLFFNRLYFVTETGIVHVYNKKHLFRMADENLHYTAGSDKILILYRGINIFPVICYDLRFPVWLRKTPSFNYDLMLLVANWPERRSMHWKTLIRARAIENQCIVAAVNRVGEDGNGIYYSGDSAILNAKGETIWEEAHKEAVVTFSINTEETNQYRNSFNVAEDADDFKLL